MKNSLMPSISAVGLNRDNASDWDALNNESRYGSLYHGTLWIGTLEASLGLNSYCFMVYRDGEPAALCPLFETQLRGFRGLATLPESDLSHLIVRDPSDTELMGAIAQHIRLTVKERRSAFVVLTFPDQAVMDAFNDGSGPMGMALPYMRNGNMSLDMNELSPKDIWDNVFSAKDAQRKYIRRFERSGFGLRETKSEDDLRRFHALYSENLVEKGATPYNHMHFEHLLRNYPEGELRMTVMEKDGEMAAGLITLFHPEKRTAHIRYAATKKDPSDSYFRRASLPVYWEAINHAYDHGYRSIGFGGTRNDPNDPTYQIKAGFGCRYEKVYSAMVSTSLMFSVPYRGYMYIKGRRA